MFTINRLELSPALRWRLGSTNVIDSSPLRDAHPDPSCGSLEERRYGPAMGGGLLSR